MLTPSRFALPLGLVATLAACTGLPSPATVGTASIPPRTSEHAEGPVEVYSRIARGALLCWMGPEGGLRKFYIFHADVSPTSDKTGAEITLHERDDKAENPRSARAFRVTIAATGSGSSVTPENFRLPPPMANIFAADVTRWAGGDTSCSHTNFSEWIATKAAREPPPGEKRTGPKKGR